MFWFLLKNKLKILLRDKQAWFWNIIFPLILGTLFNFAFANLNESFEPIDIAVVNNAAYQEETNFKTLLDSVSAEGDDKIFNIEYVNSEEEANQKLEDAEIEGYYIVKDKVEVVVGSSGLGQTMIKYMADSYYQTYSVLSNILEFDPQSFRQDLIAKINSDENHFQSADSKNNDYTVIYFYTLIGMACIYGSLFGLLAAQDSQANLSKKAARLAMAPVHKLTNLASGIVAGFIIQYIGILILLAYLVFGFGVQFGSQIPYILLLTLIGTLAGICFGLLIGVSNKKSENAKIGISVGVTMLCCFLAGMMVLQMKYLVAENVPILAEINPVAVITDGLYALYYYDSPGRYFHNIIGLIIFVIVTTLLAYIFIRRRKYDSI